MHTFTLKLDGKPVMTLGADDVVPHPDGSIDVWIRQTTAWHGKLFPGATIERNGVAANSAIKEQQKP